MGVIIIDRFDSDVAGYAIAKGKLRQLADMLANPQKYQKMGVTIPKGLLLWENPGVGKTLLAKALIDASGRKSRTIRKTDSEDKCIAKIEAIFDEANASDETCIIFLDDLDKFPSCYRRGSDVYGTIQTQIDEMGDNVFVLATSNDNEHMPESLLRAGRLEPYNIKNPEGSDAVDIIKHYLGKQKHLGDVDAELVGKILTGQNCAYLAKIVNSAGANAVYRSKKKIEMDDIMTAYLDDTNDNDDIGTHPDEQSIDILAVHEAGHIVASELLSPGSVLYAFIKPSSRENKGESVANNTDDYWYKVERMEDRVRVLLAGKVADEMIFDSTCVGCAKDIDRAYRIVDRIVTDYCRYDYCYKVGTYSDTLLAHNETQVIVEMGRYAQEVKNLLSEHRNFLLAVAEALKSNRYLLAADIQKIKAQYIVA